MTPAEMNAHMMSLFERWLFEGQLRLVYFPPSCRMGDAIGWKAPGTREPVPFARTLDLLGSAEQGIWKKHHHRRRQEHGHKYLLPFLFRKGWFFCSGAPDGKEWIFPPHSPTTIERALMSEMIKAMRRRAETPRIEREELPTHALAEEQEREDIARYGEASLDAPFSPDWASPPGHTIARLLELRAMSSDELAHGVGLLIEDVPCFLNGQIELTAEMAERLGQMFEAPVSFWVNREANYREGLARGRTDLGKTEPVEVP